MAQKRSTIRTRLRRMRAQAVETLERAMAGEGTNTQIAAAREVLGRALEEADEPKRNTRRTAAWRRSLTELSPETKARVLEELGGPAPQRRPASRRRKKT